MSRPSIKQTNMSKKYNKTSTMSIWHFHKSHNPSKPSAGFVKDSDVMPKITGDHPYFKQAKEIYETYGSPKKESPTKQFESYPRRGWGDSEYRDTLRSQWGKGARMQKLLGGEQIDENEPAQSVDSN